MVNVCYTNLLGKPHVFKPFKNSHNLFYTTVKSNAELVEDAVQIARILGREIATPDEVRKMLKLKGMDKVNF